MGRIIVFETNLKPILLDAPQIHFDTKFVIIVITEANGHMGSRVFSATGHLKKPQKQTCFFLIQSVISLDKCSYMTLRYFHIRGDFCKGVFFGLIFPTIFEYTSL